MPKSSSTIAIPRFFSCLIASRHACSFFRSIVSVRREIDDKKSKRSEAGEKPIWLSTGAAERFLKTMLCRNSVFVDKDGKEFCLSTASAFVPIARVVPFFKEQLEQDLLLHLVETQSPFTMDGLSKAAVFLFGKRNPRDTKRVEDLMIAVSESKKVVVRDDAWDIADSTC